MQVGPAGECFPARGKFFCAGGGWGGARLCFAGEAAAPTPAHAPCVVHGLGAPPLQMEGNLAAEKGGAFPAGIITSAGERTR